MIGGLVVKESKPGLFAKWTVIAATLVAALPAMAHGRLPSIGGKARPNDAAPPTIAYHGGPIMLGTNRLYIIFYGDFHDSAAPDGTRAIIKDFFANVGGSGNYNVNTTYYDANNQFISNSLAFDPVSNVYEDHYSLGKRVIPAQMPRIIANAIKGGHLPLDPNALYTVINSPDSSVFLSACAYHDSFTLDGRTLIYAEVPDFGGIRLQECSGNVQIFGESNSPNNNLGADTVLDSFMHELSEAVTDPLGTGWFTDDGNGEEVGDLCNYNYGTTYVARNGTHANTHLGNRDYLVQTIWQNTGAGFCANQLP